MPNTYLLALIAAFFVGLVVGLAGVKLAPPSELYQYRYDSYEYENQHAYDKFGGNFPSFIHVRAS